ncbi:ATV_collapsed_G0043420.mRNA.1.CDS.1 [Saccharomyces cerevisiae]|nr:ATV_collapsed_G0043420.mRNA.1.CDS.1 [Saccharomyces cerevisiae]
MNDENATIDENLKFTLRDVPPPYNDVKDEANGEANGEFDTASKENNPFADPKYKEEESRSAV